MRRSHTGAANGQGRIKALSAAKAGVLCRCVLCKTTSRPGGRQWTTASFRSHQRTMARSASQAALGDLREAQGDPVDHLQQDYTAAQEAEEPDQPDWSMQVDEETFDPTATPDDQLPVPPLPPARLRPPPPSSPILDTEDHDGHDPHLSHTTPSPTTSQEGSPPVTTPSTTTSQEAFQPPVMGPSPPHPPSTPPTFSPSVLLPSRSPSPDPEAAHRPADPHFNVDDEEPDQGLTIEELNIALSPPPAPKELERASEEPWHCYLDVHSNAGVRAVCLLLLHLHARYQLPHAGCAFVASIFYAIFVFFKIIRPIDSYTPATAPPRTLNTIYKRMRLLDRFEVKTLCPQCWEFEQFDAEQDDPDLLEELGVEGGGDKEWQRFCPRCRAPLYRPARRSEVPRPCRQAPYDLLSMQLADFLGQPGFEDACESYLDSRLDSQAFAGLQDGSVWKDMKAPDGCPFFPRTRHEAEAHDELRLGLLVSMDWFSPNSTPFAESHSTGPLSVCIANLPPERRFRVHNLCLIGILPGPKEPNAEELQRFLRPFVDDLLRLWQEGIIIKTPNKPAGRRIRAALLAVVCDHPALCKMLGFTDHRHNRWPCTQCAISREGMLEKGWDTEQIPLRDGDLHKRRAARMFELHRSGASKQQLAKYLARYGARWSEFCRLPYFDPVVQGVIDPMHAFLQGITKTLWYHVWVLGGKDGKKVLRDDTEAGRKRELSEIHSVLRTFEMPSWYARLPSQVGVPAGGSLTSDEWRALALLYGPAAIPPVLERASDRVYPKAASNYLKLATALKIWTRREIKEDELARASDLYNQFFQEFVEIYGHANVTPSFHWVTHMSHQIRRYGPVHGFWTFLFERLNKVLKGFETNGHKGGVLEVTFAREFKREMGLARMSTILAHQREDLLASLLGQELQNRGRDVARTGTLASLAAEARDQAEQETGVQRALTAGQRSVLHLNHQMQDHFLSWYQRQHNYITLRRPTDSTAPWTSTFLNTRATAFTKLWLDGKRFICSSEHRTNKSDSLVLYQFQPGTQWVGELRGILQHNQPGIQPVEPRTFALVAWLVPLQDTPPNAELYRSFPELEVDFWRHDQYIDPEVDFGPDELIPAQDICGPAARCTIELEGRKIWVTTGMSKNGRSM